MRVLFIRHAAAADAGAFRGGDLARPLTDEGRKKARTAFKALARLYPPPEVILSSEALRARQTAELLSAAFGDVEVRTSELLNPGSDFAAFRKAVLPLKADDAGIAVVGHEPDFSSILSHIVADGHLRVDVKKASCIEVDINSLGKGELKMLVTAGVLAELTT